MRVVDEDGAVNEKKVTKKVGALMLFSIGTPARAAF